LAANSERISVQKERKCAFRTAHFIKRGLDAGDTEITKRGSRLLTDSP
jgi:hypothetical protein